MVVVKFGGSSLVNATGFKNILNILRHRHEIKIVVVSACAGITDQLIDFFYSSPYQKYLISSQIIKFHRKLAHDLMALT